MKNILLSLFMLLLSLGVSGQSATRVWQTTGLSFPHGFEPYEADNSIFFNAFHPNKGFQLFQLKDDRLIQVSSFKQSLEKKEEPENLQGGQTSHYAWFNNQLYFFAKGKGITTGLYSYSYGKPKLVYACESMSNGYLQDNTLSTQVSLKVNDSMEFHHIVIDSYLKLRRYKMKQINICSELVAHNGKNYGVLDGRLGEIVLTDLGVGFYSVLFEDRNLDYVQSLRSINKGLAFIAYHQDIPHVCTISDDGTKLTYSYSENMLGKSLICDFNLGEAASSAYFVLHDQKKSRVMEMKIGQTPSEIKGDVSHNMEITGSTVLQKQMVISMSNNIASNLYQINGRELVEQEIKYVNHPNKVTQLNGTLVYSARENNNEFIFASDPLLPPKVETSTFSIFEFWPTGRVVGMVNAKSQNENGRLKYAIVSGNDGDVFRVNSSSGVLSINNAYNLKQSKKTSYTVRVEVSEKQMGSSIATVNFTVNAGKPFNHENLRETLMFFPDFSKPNTLTSTRLKDGESVFLYDINFNMIDMLIIEKGALKLQSYPPGMYILNVRNKENLYQKIERQ
jgi:hypothetical protein